MFSFEAFLSFWGSRLELCFNSTFHRLLSVFWKPHRHLLHNFFMKLNFCTRSLHPRRHHRARMMICRPSTARGLGFPSAMPQPRAIGRSSTRRQPRRMTRRGRLWRRHWESWLSKPSIASSGLALLSSSPLLLTTTKSMKPSWSVYFSGTIR